MRFLVLFLIRMFFRLFYRIKIIGLENVPLTGPVIVAVNHVSNADPPAVMSFLSLRRRAYIMAKKELFSFAPLGRAFAYFGAISVDRRAAVGDVSAIKKAVKVLEEGKCLVLFPEGTRAIEKKLKPKPGVAYLAHKTKAAVVPVRIFNTENFSKLGRIVIMFAKPMDFDFPRGKEDYCDFSEEMMNLIFSLRHNN